MNEEKLLEKILDKYDEDIKDIYTNILNREKTNKSITKHQLKRYIGDEIMDRVKTDDN